MDRARYRQLIAEFDAAGSYASTVSKTVIGQNPAEQCRAYGEQIFVKLLAHCITLRRLSPTGDRAPQSELWDLSSNSVVARAAIEAFDAMAYVALQPVDPEHRDFRILLWELHDADRRAKMLDHIGSKDARREEVVASADKLYERVVQHACFASLSKSLQGRVHDRDPPPFVNSQRERCLANGIDFDYYNAVTMQLSQYAHTLPFAVHQLFKFRAGSAEALRMMALPLQFVLPFLLRAIAGIRTVFPGLTPEPPENVSVSMVVWEEVSTTGVKSAD